MKILTFFILILIIVGGYFYYNKKIELLKKQLMITRKQYSIIKDKYSNDKKLSEKIFIKFSIPNYNAGTLKSNSSLYLSPTNSSTIINNINTPTEIGILDCAQVGNDKWFYVNIPCRNSINNRGWVNSEDISIFYTNSSSITKNN